MADQVIYKDAVVKTTLKQVKQPEDTLVPDLPFEIYGFNAISAGKDITNSMRDMALLGVEALFKIDYKAKDEALVKAFTGWLGDDPQGHADYAKHYQVTKAEKYSDYDGVDKDRPAKFCLWGYYPKPSLAIKMKGGEVVLDAGAVLHADLLDERDPADMESKGFVVDGVYYSRTDYEAFLKEYMAEHG